jgi:hypothetical protein
MWCDGGKKAMAVGPDIYTQNHDAQTSLILETCNNLPWVLASMPRSRNQSWLMVIWYFECAKSLTSNIRSI